MRGAAVRALLLAYGCIQVWPGLAQGQAPPGRVFMWRVASRTATAYVLGGAHAVSKEWYPLPQEVEDAFAASDTLLVELDVTKMDSRRFLRVIERYGAYKGDDRLWNHIRPGTAAAFRRFCAERHLDVEALACGRPWFVSMAAGPLKSSIPAGRSPSEYALGLDKHFLEAAKGKRIEQIESLESQFRLMAEMADDLQEQLLADALAHAADPPVDDDALREAWGKGDVDAVEAVYRKYLAWPPDVERVLVDARNPAMAAAVDRRLRGKGTTFVVVGAAHLLGPDSVLALLARKGHKPEQVLRSRAPR